MMNDTNDTMQSSTGKEQQQETVEQAAEPVSTAPIEKGAIQEAPEQPRGQQEEAPAPTSSAMLAQQEPAATEFSAVGDDIEDPEGPRVQVVDDLRSESQLSQQDQYAEVTESYSNDNSNSGSDVLGTTNAAAAGISDSERSRIKKRSCLFRLLDSHGCGYIARFPERWPRVFWFWFGVVAPLWMLIGIATVCGYGLAKLEAPQEIITNDNRLEINYRIGAVNLVTDRIMEKTPRICMRLYQKNSTTPEEFPHLDHEEGYYESAILLEQATNAFLNDDDGTGAEWVIDGNELFEFMSQCGKNFQRYISRIQAAGVAYVGEPADLTFNWARCVNDTDSGGFTVDLPFLGEKTYEALHPVSERDAVSWNLVCVKWSSDGSS